ncbi:hypothetical protein KEF85_01125 [Methylomonas paludis]|uniref:Uncharacterized protein n=1 Tax=Methylomonas paludis TaxID=1173101 RepID=A0A975MNZ6_9GAMM|nr:hypothetical protein [Methylomonas paludis]QWF71130.1 hypothetical protein KEF85_01125 [Methylomonas paludis]
MQALSVLEERVLFSPDLPEAVNQLLQAGVVANHVDRPRAEALFKQAQQLDGSCLQTYFALYKFYFYQGRLDEAEREVHAGLAAAALQGGFPGNYRQLAAVAASWDMYASEVSLFYLYTLKALAFIKLRQDQTDDAQYILTLLKQLDPEDRSGGSVIMQLAQALNED